MWFKHFWQSLTSLEIIKISILLAAITWIAHFWHSANFGMYEDDYSRIPLAMNMTVPQLWDNITQTILSFGGQGRPLHPSLIHLFSFLGGKLGGLKQVYWIGYVIVAINSLLFYKLLRRLSTPVFATTGALAFCLFPADTTRAFLTHSLGIQPALTFFLLAGHCYLSERRISSYLLILGSLITYETIFLVFLAVPLFKQKWNSRLFREILGHAIVIGVMLLIVFAIRVFVGENRVEGLDFKSLVFIPVRQMFIGPIVTIGTFLYRPLQMLLAGDKELLAGVALAFPVIGWTLSRLGPDVALDVHPLATFIQNKTIPLADIEFNVQLTIPESFEKLLRLAFTGFIMLILAYPLTFTVPAYMINGRSSRVHFAAIVGASILAASVCSTILFVTHTVGKNYLGILGLAGFFSLLVGFGFLVQKDYQTSWQEQQMLWQQILQLASDANNGTVILIEPDSLQNTRQIQAKSWSLARMTNQIYKFPDDWSDPPRVYLLKPGWQQEIVTDESLFQLNDFTVVSSHAEHRVIKSTSIILLENNAGQLTRRDEPLTIACKEFPLKTTLEPVLTSLEKGFLFDYLVPEPSAP